MARWANGEQTVQFLVDRNRLESFEAEDVAALAAALLARAILRVETTAATVIKEVTRRSASGHIDYNI